MEVSSCRIRVQYGKAVKQITEGCLSAKQNAKVDLLSGLGNSGFRVPGSNPGLAILNFNSQCLGSSRRSAVPFGYFNNVFTSGISSVRSQYPLPVIWSGSMVTERGCLKLTALPIDDYKGW